MKNQSPPNHRQYVFGQLPLVKRWLLLLSSILCLPFGGHAQVTFENAFPSLTFAFPVEIQNTGVSGDDRLFVVSQRGTIQVFNNDAATTNATQFLDIQSDVLFNVGQELGLLGLAFHPNYATNGWFYVYYTRSASGTPEIVVERFRVNANNPNQADQSARQVIFSVVKNQSNSNHNGGKIAFGPDGYLYVSIGDGGGGGDPKRNGQNVDTYFGSILRIDVDLNGDNPVDANGLPPEGRYEVPTDNPLVGESGRDEIYAWGIRNTWKMSFDPPTGRLWGGDVGQNAFEEINLITPGNFGWNRFEANSVFNGNIPDPGNAIGPTFFYDRSNGDRSVTGGYVYRGSQITSTSPSIVGKYIFADYVSGRVWALDYNPTTQEATRELLFRASDGSSVNVSTFGLDINGEMYFAGYGSSGTIYRLKDGVTGENAVAVAGVGSWNDDLGSINGEVNAIVMAADQTVYVGGDFSEVGTGVVANNLAKWTPSEGWQSVGAGTNGVVNALALGADGSLYVGGSFTTAGSTSARNVARYTSASGWQPLAGGVNGAALAMVTAGNTLYVGGAFVAADGTTVNNVAQWDGVWSPLQDSNTQQAGTNNEVRSLAVDEVGNLYVGGNFGSAGGNEASRIARWDGSTWSDLGEGTSGFVQAILVTEDYVYAGGNFTIAGGQTVNRIARWNRSSASWSLLAGGLSNSVNALATDGDFIYAGGQFRNALNSGSADNIIVNNLVRWSEDTGWEALGESTNVGVDNLINALDFAGSELYAGGRFETAGGQATQNLATWAAPPVSPDPSPPFEAGSISIQQPNRTTWRTVDLDQTFAQPIVVVSPPTYNGSQPTTVRVRNVTSSSFEVQLDEWEYLDGWHVTETLNYLVVEAGSSALAGLAVEAGPLLVGNTFKTQSFAQSFPTTPVVLVQCASDSESTAVSARLRNVSTEGFEVRLQEEEAADDVHADEVLHYIALAPGTGNEADWNVEATALGTSFTDKWRAIDFLSSHSSPLFFATMQSYRGGDAAALRYRSLNTNRVEVKVEEEQSRDNEVKHTQEAIGYLVLSNQNEGSGATARTASPELAAETIAFSSERWIYPNPVRVGEDIVLSSSAAEPNQFTVYNAQGQTLAAGQTVDQPKVNTQGWQPGLYFVRRQGEHGTQTQRLLVVE